MSTVNDAVVSFRQEDPSAEAQARKGHAFHLLEQWHPGLMRGLDWKDPGTALGLLRGRLRETPITVEGFTELLVLSTNPDMAGARSVVEIAAGDATHLNQAAALQALAEVGDVRAQEELRRRSSAKIRGETREGVARRVLGLE